MPTQISKTMIVQERMRRQGIAKPVTSDETYARLFRNLQPASPVHNTRPGSPPVLEHRAAFNDQKLTDSWRANHTIIKGRFHHGYIGYIFQDDLDTYANAFARPMKTFTERQAAVWDCVSQLGPVNKAIIKEETGLLMKHISPALTRLQEAFLVYEDQVDDDWERGWESVESVWPEIEIAGHKQSEARKQVLLRFLDGHVFVTPTQVHDWSDFPSKTIQALMEELESEQQANWGNVEGFGEGWSISNIAEVPDTQPWRGVRALSKADLLCRSHETALKERFNGLETLCYLLIDGEFSGAVTGHWGFGDYDIDDIVILLPEADQQVRKQEILDAVTQIYAPEHHRIMRYSGKLL